MTIILLLRILNISNSSISFLGNYPFLAIGFAIIEMIAAFKYYSEERILNLNKNFIQKKIFEKRIWGYVAIFTLIIPILIGALLLNNGK